MSDKVIDIDPIKRLTKESLGRIKETISGMTADDLDGLILLYTTSEGKTIMEAYGADLQLIVIGKDFLNDLKDSVLYDRRGDD